MFQGAVTETGLGRGGREREREWEEAMQTVIAFLKCKFSALWEQTS